MNHVVIMTSTTSIGLMTLFVVDLVDMYFLSLLGETALASAIGYAGTVLFFTTSKMKVMSWLGSVVFSIS